MIKNIVFDLGGVVLNFDPIYIANEYPGDKNMPKFLFKSGFFNSVWCEFDRGTLSQDEIVQRMADASGVSCDECYSFILFIRNSLTNIPQTIQLLEELKADNYKLFCLSNMSAEFYDYLKVRDFFQLFDGQIISAHEHLIKPDPTIFHLLLNRFQLDASETMFIDDLANNVAAAQSVGIYGIDFSNKKQGYININKLLNR